MTYDYFGSVYTMYCTLVGVLLLRHVDDQMALAAATWTPVYMTQDMYVGSV